MRLSVGAVVVVRLVDGVMNRHPVRTRRIRAGTSSLLDSETAVHLAGPQLHWLDHTDGEPDRKHAGESFNDGIAAHESNLG
jgi:hypothetical protein